MYAALIAPAPVGGHVTAFIYPNRKDKDSFPAMSLHFIVPGSLRSGRTPPLPFEFDAPFALALPLPLAFAKFEADATADSLCPMILLFA